MRKSNTGLFDTPLKTRPRQNSANRCILLQETGVIAAVEEEVQLDYHQAASKQPKPPSESGSGKEWGHWGKPTASLVMNSNLSGSGGMSSTPQTAPSASSSDASSKEYNEGVEWRGPKKGEPPLSSMQRFSSLGSKGGPRRGFYELRNVRMQNRTIWVYTGAPLTGFSVE